MDRDEKERRARAKREHLAKDPIWRELHARAEAVTRAQISSAPHLQAEYVIVQQVLRMTESQRKFLAPEIKMLHATWVVESEVMNGGFDQFFTSHGDETLRLAGAGYRLFGIDEGAEAISLALGGAAGEAEEVLYRFAADISSKKDSFVRGNANLFQIGS
jgi:hypothetical protein